MASSTKQKLMQVTREVIDTQGVEDVSMRRIGRRTGLSRSAVYRHFDSKESLLAAIVAENFQLLLGKMDQFTQRDSDPTSQLMDMLHMYYDFAMANPDHYHLMFNTKWPEEKFPDIKEAAFAVYNNTADLVSRAQGAHGDALRSVREVTAIIYAFIHGLTELHLTGHKHEEKGMDDEGLLIARLVKSLFC